MNEKRFFRADDSGCLFFVVASDLEGAKAVLRASRCEFNDPSVPFDHAKLVWSELSTEQAARKRCHLDGEESRVVPLTACAVGDYFCSEW